jgi:hypothetical protein
MGSPERGSEIAANDSPYPCEVLNMNRLIQTQLLSENLISLSVITSLFCPQHDCYRITWA